MSHFAFEIAFLVTQSIQIWWERKNTISQNGVSFIYGRLVAKNTLSHSLAHTHAHANRIDSRIWAKKIQMFCNLDTRTSHHYVYARFAKEINISQPTARAEDVAVKKLHFFWLGSGQKHTETHTQPVCVYHYF